MLQSPQIEVHNRGHSMKKELVFLALLAMVAFIGCKGNETTPEEDIDQYEGVPDNDNDIAENEDCCGPEEDTDISDADITCTASDSFFDDMPVEWQTYFTLKMSGLINDPQNTAPDYTWLVKTNVRLLGEMLNLGDNYAMYVRDSVTLTDGTTPPAIIAMSTGNVSWPVTDKLVSVWVAQTYLLIDDLMDWKAQATALEVGSMDLNETYPVSIYETWLEINGSAQNLRMECVRGLSAWNSEKNIYDGALFVCTCCNDSWAVGESMAIMNYSKMIDDPVELLAALNEGLTSEDPEYRTDLCRCYEPDGVTPMDCEAMKDEFGLGELPDDDTLLTDETPDDDVLIAD